MTVYNDSYCSVSLSLHPACILLHTHPIIHTYRRRTHACTYTSNISSCICNLLISSSSYTFVSTNKRLNYGLASFYSSIYAACVFLLTTHDRYFSLNHERVVIYFVYCVTAVVAIHRCGVCTSHRA